MMKLRKQKPVAYTGAGEEVYEGDKVCILRGGGREVQVTVSHILFPGQKSKPLHVKDRSGYKYEAHTDDISGRW
jgi:hypothetical protein